MTSYETSNLRHDNGGPISSTEEMAQPILIQPDYHSATTNLLGRSRHDAGGVNQQETFEPARDGIYGYSDTQEFAHALFHHWSVANQQSVEFKHTEAATDKSTTKLAVLWVWRFEFLALLISCAAFAAISALLGVYHEKPQPEFAYNMNINTLIAILSTILRATLVFVVAEGE